MARAEIVRMAKQSGKPIKDLEKMWDDFGKVYDSKKYYNKYSFIIGLMKKNLGLDKRFNSLHGALLNKYQEKKA